ncbi:unnamed protein product [Schistocephalus solidus]|uniref:EF-hand domain-containing protein n=1 Tax=Schistocephalus solidus TaxID=70667 RepID=A0A183TES1_SCHSO|nr:unnamed protein product [Schistocephalus solidus]
MLDSSLAAILGNVFCLNAHQPAKSATLTVGGEWSLEEAEHYVTSNYYRPQHVRPAAQYGRVSSLNRPPYDLHRLDAEQFTTLFKRQSHWPHLSLPLFRLLDQDKDNLINLREYSDIPDSEILELEVRRSVTEKIGQKLKGKQIYSIQNLRELH